jgi:hypothetical protein
MSNESKITTNHKEIIEWAEKRNGIPASVKGTDSKNDPGVIRITFQDTDETFEPIDWKDFFEKFEENNLAFVYQEETQDGQLSRFSKLVSRNNLN